MVRLTDIFHLAIYCYRYMGSRDTAFNRLFRGYPRSRQAYIIHSIYKAIPVGIQLQQGTHEHIARGAHSTFKE
jgi:hypothetical protein